MEFVIIAMIAVGLYMIVERIDDSRGGKAESQGFRPNSSEME
jgi:hypothetical protein